jgi:hypothetical protein
VTDCTDRAMELLLNAPKWVSDFDGICADADTLCVSLLTLEFDGTSDWLVVCEISMSDVVCAEVLVGVNICSLVDEATSDNDEIPPAAD